MSTISCIHCGLGWLDKEPLALFLLIKTAQTGQHVMHLDSGRKF